jgi:hypothetical protein
MAESLPLVPASNAALAATDGLEEGLGRFAFELGEFLW